MWGNYISGFSRQCQYNSGAMVCLFRCKNSLHPPMFTQRVKVAIMIHPIESFSLEKLESPEFGFCYA